MDDALSSLVWARTGLKLFIINFVDGVKRTHQMLNVHVPTGLLTVSFYLMVGKTVYLRKSRCGDLADQPGSVVV